MSRSIEIIRGHQHLRDNGPGSVVSIGNFDGFHLGHQALIERLRQLSSEFSLPSCIVTFEPHPLEYFAGSEAPPRLMSFRQKAEILAASGIDRLVCLRFNENLASTSAQLFVEDILVGSLGSRHILVGDDFRFGKNRVGDFDYLTRQGKTLGFSVENTRTLSVDEERVSSSRIRVCLAKGDLEKAAKLLGRPWAVSGRIVHGDKRGREWGFPTINLLPSWHRPPVTGIFAVTVDGLADASLAGAGYIGRRPVLNDDRLVVEVHLLDFAGDVYGRRVCVNFHTKIRDDHHFDDVEKLKEQMTHDLEETRASLQGLIAQKSVGL